MKTTETNPRRRWFRFSLRTMLVLVTFLAIPLGWVGCQLNWIRQRHAFLKQDGVYPSAPGHPGPNSFEIYYVRPPAFLGYFGERGLGDIAVAAEEQLSEAKRLFPEAVYISVDYSGRIDYDYKQFLRSEGFR